MLTWKSVHCAVSGSYPAAKAPQRCGITGWTGSYGAKTAGLQNHTVPSLKTKFCETFRTSVDPAQLTMAPTLSEDEIDDLIYLARVGENDELKESLAALAEREKVSHAEILIAAKDEGKSTALHMATGNGHLGMSK